MPYRLIRYYFSGDKEELGTVETKEEAVEHCSDPQTSSTTCTSVEGLARTEEFGPWFDGHREI